MQLPVGSDLAPLLLLSTDQAERGLHEIHPDIKKVADGTPARAPLISPTKLDFSSHEISSQAWNLLNGKLRYIVLKHKSLPLVCCLFPIIEVICSLCWRGKRKIIKLLCYKLLISQTWVGRLGWSNYTQDKLSQLML